MPQPSPPTRAGRTPIVKCVVVVVFACNIGNTSWPLMIQSVTTTRRPTAKSRRGDAGTRCIALRCVGPGVVWWWPTLRRRPPFYARFESALQTVSLPLSYSRRSISIRFCLGARARALMSHCWCGSFEISLAHTLSASLGQREGADGAGPNSRAVLCVFVCGDAPARQRHCGNSISFKGPQGPARLTSSAPTSSDSVSRLERGL